MSSAIAAKSARAGSTWRNVSGCSSGMRTLCQNVIAQALRSCSADPVESGPPQSRNGASARRQRDRGAGKLRRVATYNGSPERRYDHS